MAMVAACSIVCYPPAPPNRRRRTPGIQIISLRRDHSSHPPPLEKNSSSSSRSSPSSSSSSSSSSPALRFVVSGTTELIRFFTNQRKDEASSSNRDLIPSKRNITRVQDVIDALIADYQQAYFLTGNFTRSLYAEDCYFADPTISFTGADLYEQNLKLLIPFLEKPSLTLYGVDEESDDESQAIRAAWQLRTYLKLPWRPLICIDGSTIYKLDEELMIVSHIESWAVSPLVAISQIFKWGDNPF